MSSISLMQPSWYILFNSARLPVFVDLDVPIFWRLVKVLHLYATGIDSSGPLEGDYRRLVYKQSKIPLIYLCTPCFGYRLVYGTRRYNPRLSFVILFANGIPSKLSKVSSISGVNFTYTIVLHHTTLDPGTTSLRGLKVTVHTLKTWSWLHTGLIYHHKSELDF